jgi:hypothetical protein
MCAPSQVSAWFDEGILRQREAKAAVLAIRRHLRCEPWPHVCFQAASIA